MQGTGCRAQPGGDRSQLVMMVNGARIKRKTPCHGHMYEASCLPFCLVSAGSVLVLLLLLVSVLVTGSSCAHEVAFTAVPSPELCFRAVSQY